MTDTTTQERNITDGKFNGWTNYETWRVNLEMWDGYEIEHGEFDDVESLADYLNLVSDEIIMGQSEGIAQDYALAFLSAVNWHEIASHKADEYGLFNDDESEDE